MAILETIEDTISDPICSTSGESEVSDSSGLEMLDTLEMVDTLEMDTE